MDFHRLVSKCFCVIFIINTLIFRRYKNYSIIITNQAKKEKPVKTEKRKKEKKAVEKSVEATPIENPRKEKYESEFDDILLDLERSKAPKEEENIDISKDGDGNGGDEA